MVEEQEYILRVKRGPEIGVLDVACYKCESYDVDVKKEPCKSCDSMTFHGNFKRRVG